MRIDAGVLRYEFGGALQTLNFPMDATTTGPGVSIEAHVDTRERSRRIGVTLRPDSPIVVQELMLTGEHRFTETARIFCNGYQSWTDSREFTSRERMPKLWRLAQWLGLRAYGDYSFAPYAKGPGQLHSFTYVYVRSGATIQLVASLSEHAGYTLFRIDTHRGEVRISKDCAGLHLSQPYEAFDLLQRDGGEDEAFAAYFDRLPTPRRSARPRSGWTSWYNYYTHITEEILLDNLGAFADQKIPIEIFQIDDGYQRAVGDWLEPKPAFPRGMGHLAEAIHAADYRAGLWLAPFLCEKRSRLFAEKPEWLLKDRRGKPVVAGYNPAWSGRFYALDLYHPPVREYLREVFSTVLNDWGYDLVKLDFLYAAALSPPPERTRGQAMAEGMAFLRECVGDKEILGCGVPLGSAFGLVEYCRIGSDVALKWEDRLLQTIHYRERVSTLSSLRSTIGRRHLNEAVFINDPDVFILRRHNNTLDLEEKYTLVVLNNLFGGLIFTSDHVGQYAEAELDRYRSIFPLRRKQIRSVAEVAELYTIDVEIDGLAYRVYSNLGDRPRRVRLPEGVFFSAHDAELLRGEAELSLSPHATRCWLRVPAREFAVAGTTGHLFPGSEIESLDVKDRAITVQLRKDFINDGRVWVTVPGDGSYAVNGHEVNATMPVEGLRVVTANLR